MAKTGLSGFMPVCLNLRGKPCLVVGGGNVAWRKISVLRKFGAQVTCMSRDFIDPLKSVKDSKGIRCINSPYPRTMNLKKFALVIAATDDPGVNKRVARDASRDKILVNVVDNSVPGSFIMPAILKQNGLTIGVSTGGRDPGRAKKIRNILRHAL